MLLVYALQNRVDIPSLWGVLHPKVPMRWAWDQGADGRVVELWQLREELSRERGVVYGKWFRGRATFFSRPLFAAMLAAYRGAHRAELATESRELLRLLEDDSPQSTKQLRRAAQLTGRESERVFVRAMKELWERLLIVGVGEQDDGAFPSLRIGATSLLFEDLWERDTSDGASSAAHARRIAQQLPAHTEFGRHFQKILKSYAR